MTDSTPSTVNIDKLEYAVWPSYSLLAGIQLDLFTALKDGPMSVEQIARGLGVRADRLQPLLYALVAIGLLKIEGGLISNTHEASHFLVRGSPTYRGGKHESFLNNWKAGLRTADSIRAGSPQAKLDFSAASGDRLAMFYRSTFAQALRRGRELAAIYDLSAHYSLLDVGGGTGGLAIAITEACPRLHATVVDLPTVTPFTEQFIDEASARGRVDVVAADLSKDSIMGSFDVAVLSSLLQVVSPDKARILLKNVGKVMNPGAIIYIRGDVLDDSRVSPMGSVMRNLIYLNLYDEGQAYTETEHREWLEEAGFDHFERKTLPDEFSLMQARKAK
ncbi:MAG: methyltransferase [Candidatus Binatia bacterium]